MPSWLLLAAALSSCAGSPSGSEDDAVPRKSVFVGELLAIFPGLIVHGMGHRYAGNSERANEILAMEGYSLLTAGVGGALLAIGSSQDAEAVEVGGWIGIGLGSVVFLGTWLYDIIFTPGEVARYNRQAAGE